MGEQKKIERGAFLAHKQREGAGGPQGEGGGNPKPQPAPKVFPYFVIFPHPRGEKGPPPTGEGAKKKTGGGPSVLGWGGEGGKNFPQGGASPHGHQGKMRGKQNFLPKAGKGHIRHAGFGPPPPTTPPPKLTPF